MTNIFSIVSVVLLNLTPPAAAGEQGISLVQDCFNEWKSRAWVIGEDNIPAHEVPKFAEGIRKVCQIRSQMYDDDPSVSPYIQGRLAELAPYLFSGDDEAIKQLIKKLQTRRPGQSYSGSFMRD